MGYVPNAIAQSLQQQQSCTIGVVISDMADPFWGEVVKGIDAVCATSGQSLLLHAAAHDEKLQITAIRRLQRRRVDGIIVVDSQLGPSEIRQLEASGSPMVFINSQRTFESTSLRSVTIDNYAGGAIAADHLVALGHQKVAYFGSPKRPGSNLKRSLGFIETLVAHGLQRSRIFQDECAADIADIDGGYTMAQALNEPGVTAVFCYNDAIALGALAGFRAKGVAVPHKISVVGFDDLAMARYSWPPLTTIAQPKELLGQTAMHNLATLIGGASVADAVLVPSLLIRDSSTPLSKGLRA
jgi:LacI family transcriptional regulator/LacI family repressor for deo operon, udp, cdd, tsx, nupC, and nupG